MFFSTGITDAGVSALGLFYTPDRADQHRVKHADADAKLRFIEVDTGLSYSWVRGVSLFFNSGWDEFSLIHVVLTGTGSAYYSKFDFN